MKLISAQTSQKAIQINLCQKLLFLHQLTHNMTTDCSLNYNFNTWKFQAQTRLCTEIVSEIQIFFCTQHVLPMFCKKKSFWQRFTCTWTIWRKPNNYVLGFTIFLCLFPKFISLKPIGEFFLDTIVHNKTVNLTLVSWSQIMDVEPNRPPWGSFPLSDEIISSICSKKSWKSYKW